MSELEFDFGIEHTGYRLSYFQAYNWGTFDSHIVTVQTDGKNSLLTGSNGSGKTTLVDGLLTLLVPSNYRSYNLSSGTDGKKGRTEESYVLGTYSTEKSENDYASSRKTLRDKDCHSILLACFGNDTAAHSLTLMQIRYFSSNGSLCKQFFLIEGDFSLEMMDEKNVGYTTSSNWIQNIKKAFPELTINNYDSFKRYSLEFSRHFGFRSLDKALRIFSQTVGMKDLSNLNDFIRTKMLDEEDIFSQYLEILKNYHNLMDMKNTIDKEEKQIEILTNVKNSGLDFKLFTNELSTKTYYRDQVLPLWEAQTSIDRLQQNIQTMTQEIQDRVAAKENLTEEINTIASQIEDIQNTLRNDNRERKISELKARRASVKNLLDNKEHTRMLYQRNIDIADLPFPQDEVAFHTIKVAASDKRETLKNENLHLEDNKNDCAIERRGYLREKEAFIKQLEAIGDRQSNIPQYYLITRDRMCNDLGIEKNEIRYIGELIQVKEDFSEESTSIETLLNPLSLTLLVLPQNLTKVSRWLEKENLKERIEVRILDDLTISEADDDDSDDIEIEEGDDEILFGDEEHEFNLNQMLEIKKDFAYKNYLKNLLATHFNLSLNKDLSILLKENGYFSLNGLAHLDNKIVKGITDEDVDFRTLGWDTEKKKAKLQEKIRVLANQIENIDSELKKINTSLAMNDRVMKALEALEEERSWDDINTLPQSSEIENIDSQLEALLADTKDLDILRAKRDDLLTKKHQKEREKEELIKNIGAGENSLQQDQDALVLFENEITRRKITSYLEPVAKLQEEYRIPSAFGNLRDIEIASSNVRGQLNKELSAIENKLDKAHRNLRKYMNDFSRPNKDIIEKYPTWTADATDLNDDTDNLPLYEAILDKLQNESLPRFKADFNKMQTRQMRHDIVDLNIRLNKWDKNIRNNIRDLNESLSILTYQSDPETKIRLTIEGTKDSNIRRFKKLLTAAQPDSGFDLLSDNDKALANAKFMTGIETLISALMKEESFTRKVLDVRNWHNYAVEEYLTETGEQYRFYADSSGISGGQKAKLAYTILAAAIAHQFDVFNATNQSRAFRFVIVDEAFSKSDDNNSKYAMKLFKAMDLQLMVVTPMDKVNLVEPFIESIQVTICQDSKHSFVHNINKEEKSEFISGNSQEDTK